MDDFRYELWARRAQKTMTYTTLLMAKLKQWNTNSTSDLSSFFFILIFICINNLLSQVYAKK